MPAKKKTKEKKFVLRSCPKCKSSDVEVPLGAKIGTWQCKSCKYKGIDFDEREVSEEEFLEQFNVSDEDIENTLGEPETVEEKGAKKSYKDLLREKVARGEKI